MKRTFIFIICIILICLTAGCHSVSKIPASRTDIYKVQPADPEFKLTEEQKLYLAKQTVNLLDNIIATGCGEEAFKEASKNTNFILEYVNEQTPNGKFMLSSGRLLDSILKNKYRVNDNKAFFEALNNYYKAYEGLHGTVRATYKPIEKSKFLSAYLAAWQRGKIDYNHNALSFAGGFSYTGISKEQKSFADVFKGQKASYVLELMQPVFQADNFTIVNNFTVLSDNKLKAAAENPFTAPLSYAKLYKDVSVEGVAVENSHLSDFGEEGRKDTLEAFKAESLPAITFDAPFAASYNDTEVLVLSINAGGKEGDAPFKKAALDRITKLKTGTNSIAVNVYWGKIEETVSDFQKSFSRELLNAGADLVIGVGEGPLQGAENIKDRYVFYNIGQMVNGDDYTLKNRQAIVAVAKFKNVNGKTILDRVSVVPCFVNSNGSKDENDFKPAPQFEKTADEIIGGIISKSGKLENGITSLDYLKTSQ